MNRLLLSVVFLSISLFYSLPSYSQARSQNSLSGAVSDSLSGKPVPYATVTIMGEESEIVTAVAADGNGKFRLAINEPGDYILVITAVGYIQYAGPVSVDGNIQAGTVALTPGIEVDQIQVTAQRPLITADADKMTYSVDADPEGATSTMLEILRKVPQLSVDAEGNVLLNGKSNYKVLVNGKSSSMMAKNFKDVIKSMPASSVKDIEVITNPSTRYESEGVGGIINIITTRRSIDGYSGRVAGSFGLPESYNGSAYVSAQFGKFTVSANYWAGYYDHPGSRTYIDQTNYQIPDRYRSHNASRSNGDGFNQSGSLEASYEIDSLNLLSLSFSIWSGNFNSDYRGIYSALNIAGDTTSRVLNHGQTKNRWGSVSGSLDYQRTFAKPDRTFTLSYKLEGNPTRSKYNNGLDSLVINGAPDYRSTIRRSDNKASGMEHTLQADYYDPLNQKHHIEAGIKYILRTNTSDTEREIFENEIWAPDLVTSNGDLDYDQHIFGAYGGYLFKPGKFTAKAGFRMEGTWNDGKAKTRDGDVNFKNTQFNVVPYAQLSYMVKPTQSASLSYTQRLQRPGIWYLNPYVDDSDPTHINYGNPDLEAVVNHTISANYSIFSMSWNLFMGGYATFSNDNITQITEVINDPSGGQSGVMATTYKNLGVQRWGGAFASFSYRLNTVFNVNASVNGSYNYIEAKSEGLKNEGFNYGGNLGFGVTLWKGARIHANGGVWSSQYQLQGKGSTFYYTSYGITQKLFKDKFDLNFSVTDPHRKDRKYTYTTVDPAFESRSVSYGRVRRFNFAIGYRFGKMDVSVKKTRRSITNDDKMAGGGGQGGATTGG